MLSVRHGGERSRQRQLNITRKLVISKGTLYLAIYFSHYIMIIYSGLRLTNLNRKQKEKSSTPAEGAMYFAPLAPPPSGGYVIKFADDAVRFAPKDVLCTSDWKQRNELPKDAHAYLALSHLIHRLYDCATNSLKVRMWR